MVQSLLKSRKGRHCIICLEGKNRCFSMEKSLEYLDLEVRHVYHKFTLDNKYYYCFSEKQGHKHRFHTEDQQLNLLCDSSYHILHNLTCLCEKISTSIAKTKISFEKLSKKLDNLEENLSYLKNQRENRNILIKEEINQILTTEFQKTRQKNTASFKSLEEKIQRTESLLLKLIGE
ncbi:ORF1 [Dioscorea nummularia-associated virus]|uniref:ORF1 n=1 Tax=Dioscorea nummularia-associated virus TaxID=2303485 RepID=A0A346RP32_9VIRU|nr:ORF1 [Dioscorea nummularia-associated virus]AXS67829.1 ORF1 [Dioscorea nummularia-associated virus]